MQGAGLGGEQGTDTGALQGGGGEGVVEVAERHLGEADVRGPGAGEQSGAEDLGGQGEGDLVRPGVEGGDADEVPQGVDGGPVLSVPLQPVAEALGVQGGVGGVQPAQGQGGAAHGGAFGEGEVRVAGEPGGQVQRDGGRGAAQPADAAGAGVQDGDVHAALHRGEGGAADAAQKALVGGAAAQVHMLAVVDGERSRGAVAAEGEGEAAEPGAGLGEGHGVAAVGEGEGGGGSGEAAADDQCAGHGWACRAMRRASRPVRPRTATRTFSGAGRATRPRRTAAGSSAMRSSSRW